MRIGCKNYAQRLLEKTGCDLDCYKGEEIETIVADLKYYYAEHPLELDYPVEDVAKCLREIGDEQPDPPMQGHKKYKMVFDMIDTVDAIEFDSFEAAKADMEDTYILWMTEACHNWEIINGIPYPTEEQIEDYDYMIDNCCCWIVKWNDELNSYEDVDDGYVLPQEEIEALGWMEWNKFAKLNGWS